MMVYYTRPDRNIQPYDHLLEINHVSEKKNTIE